MLIKELPEVVWNKTFSNIKEFIVFVYEEQLITEYWELSEKEVSQNMLKELEKAKKIPRNKFVNL